MNSNMNNTNQHGDCRKNDQIESTEFENGNNPFNSETIVSDNQLGDSQQPVEANQFAMDVNLNLFEGFSQVQDQSEAGLHDSTAIDEQQQQQDRRQFRGRQVRGPGGEEEEEKDILNKIFVGGIHPDTTEDNLKEHFAKFGSIVDHVIIKDPTTKRSRGFGFVKYSESSAVDEVMKNRPHLIDNKKLDVKRSTPRKDAVKMESSANVNKLFVGGLDENILETDLREYFGQFGNITEVVIKSPKEGVRVRAFAFITFDDYDPVDKVIITKNHTIKTLKLTVRKGYVEQSGGKFVGGMSNQFQYGQQQFQYGGRGVRGGYQMQGFSQVGRGGGNRGRGRGGNSGRMNKISGTGSSAVGGGAGFNNMDFGCTYGDDGSMGGAASYYGAYNSQGMGGGMGAGGKIIGGQNGNIQGGPMRRPYQKRNFNQAAFSPY